MTGPVAFSSSPSVAARLPQRGLGPDFAGRRPAVGRPTPSPLIMIVTGGGESPAVEAERHALDMARG